MYANDTHPLLIDLVLHRVLSYCDLKDLKKCRLVNSIWKIESSLHLRKKSKITLSDIFLTILLNDSSIYRQLQAFKPHNLRVAKFEDRLPLPFLQNLTQDLQESIKYLQFDLYNHIQSLELLSAILNGNHPHLVHLRIEFRKTILKPEVSQTAFEIQEIRSIRKLELVLDCKSRDLDRAKQLALVHKILKITPNLTSLSIDSKWQKEFNYSHRLINQGVPNPVNTCLEYLLTSPETCPHLHDLVLQDVTDLDILALTDLGIKLRSLKISPSDHFPITDFRKFEQLLKKQSNSLEELEFEICDAKKPTCFTFPTLSKLRSLRILIKRSFSYRCEEFGMNMSFAKVQYETVFPVLERLTVCPLSFFNGFEVDAQEVWKKAKVYEAFFPILKEDVQVCRTLRDLKVPLNGLISGSGNELNHCLRTLFPNYCDKYTRE